MAVTPPLCEVYLKSSYKLPKLVISESFVLCYHLKFSLYPSEHIILVCTVYRCSEMAVSVVTIKAYMYCIHCNIFLVYLTGVCVCINH